MLGNTLPNFKIWHNLAVIRVKWTETHIFINFSTSPDEIWGGCKNEVGKNWQILREIRWVFQKSRKKIAFQEKNCWVGSKRCQKFFFSLCSANFFLTPLVSLGNYWYFTHFRVLLCLNWSCDVTGGGNFWKFENLDFIIEFPMPKLV